MVVACKWLLVGDWWLVVGVPWVVGGFWLVVGCALSVMRGCGGWCDCRGVGGVIVGGGLCYWRWWVVGGDWLG